MGVSRWDAYVPIAIQSVLDQSLAAFELIVIANGESVDSLAAKLEAHYSSEPRLVVLKSRIPQLAHALNLGIENAAYDYIARMDADDVAHPQWLSNQFDYLNHHQLDMVGCALRLIDGEGNYLGERMYPRADEIQKRLGFKNCFAHNSIIIKKKTLLAARGYNAGLNTEDYDLWLRLRRLGVRWDNTLNPLIDYRIHDKSSQRTRLSYAEAAGLATREFVLQTNMSNFFALCSHLARAWIRSK
jgi:glycosyltransferase involved in cell wall biosynthesis